MVEVLVNYEGKVSDQDGLSYSAQACGRPLSDDLWEGWIEFVPEDGSETLRTRRETTQPNREDLEYWASGLELVYLEGALRRALTPERKSDTAAVPAEAPVYEAPAPDSHHEHAGPHAALDPFKIHAAQGDEVLRRQLAALESWQLRNVAIVHTSVTESEAEGMDRQQLASAILKTVRS